jgi:Protein of unknown function (Hypoth_ymh)
MQTKVAVDSLKGLKLEAEQNGYGFQNSEDKFTSWKGRVRSVLSRALGVDHHLTQDFSKVKYETFSPTVIAVQNAFMQGLKEACGIIDAAIYDLELGGTSDEAVDESAFDIELWKHVQGHIQNEDWSTVASQTAIFVEDRIRAWSGNPKDKDGRSLVGKGLYSRVFADDGEYRLGSEPGEWEGWRMLSIGFAQALGNVDRHNIQRRPDAKRYAFGVLGLGSLILTQLRYQHGDHLRIDNNR